MRLTNERKLRSKMDKGFTLLEMLLVLAILSVLLLIAVPSVTGITRTAKLKACEVNRVRVERDFEEYMMMNRLNYTDSLFQTYIRNFPERLCPADGEFIYVQGEIECSVHSDGEEHEDDGGSVPYL